MSMTFLRMQDFPDGLEQHAFCVMNGESEPVDVNGVHARVLRDEFVAYLVGVRPGFDLLRDALTQVTAILLLIAAGSRDAIAHPMLTVAEAHGSEAHEALATLQVPRDAQHGHRHLMAASHALMAALGAARSVRVADALDVIDERVRRGVRELHFAAGHLPGLDIVSGDQACACHASSAKAE